MRRLGQPSSRALAGGTYDKAPNFVRIFCQGLTPSDHGLNFGAKAPADGCKEHEKKVDLNIDTGWTYYLDVDGKSSDKIAPPTHTPRAPSHNMERWLRNYRSSKSSCSGATMRLIKANTEK